MPSDRYLERSFPIVQLNPLSVRERNAFKPIYKMHKWFARRSSSIFRAILLGATLPYEDENGQPIDLMAEFYKGHGDDPRLRRPDGSPLRVLDPFMGGGTTVVEALRLGFDVTGIDYNPIAWFIVKGETTPVDRQALDGAYQRVAAEVKEELLALYKTRCPLTGKDADIVYSFWVKQGICVDPSCQKPTDLFRGYEVARKRGDCSLRYKPDVVCPECQEIFDWELDRCTITAGGPQILGDSAAGKGRPAGTHVAFGLETERVVCPHCHATIAATQVEKVPTKTKSIPLHVLVDPVTGDFFEVRGGIPPMVTAPASGHSFDPEGGNVEGAKFRCMHCGRKQDIVSSARANRRPLPFRYYGFYAYTSHAADREVFTAAQEMGLPTNNDKWFGAAAADDLKRIDDAASELERLRGWRNEKGEIEKIEINEPPANRHAPRLLRASSLAISEPTGTVDLVVTDPPYAGSVQYAEMSDWYYVWLHQILKDKYPDEFGPEITLKSEEIIEDDRTKDVQFFFDNLTNAWRECHRVLKDDGLLVFTFHHREGDRWAGLLKSLFDAGFYLIAAYPSHSEALNSIVIQATEGITYDIIHVCRKRIGEVEAIPWTRLRREVQREARAQLKELEQGKDVLPGPDVWMILLGKALRLFSLHYGKVLDADGQALDLEEAMERISLLMREVRGEELPLPAALQEVDSLTQVALLHVVGAKSWTRDGLHIELRGYAHGPDRLIEVGLVREVKGQKGQLESIPPLERFKGYSDRIDRRREGPLIDKVHILLGTVQVGHTVDALMKNWRGHWGVIGEGLGWLAKADPGVRDLAGLTLRAVEALGPDRPVIKPEQLGFFGS